MQRVSSAGCGTAWSQTFTYDAFGNITKSGSGSFAPSYTFSGGITTNQFFSIPGVTVSCDKNGNLLTDNLNTYTWDPNWGCAATGELEARSTAGTSATTTIFRPRLLA